MRRRANTNKAWVGPKTEAINTSSILTALFGVYAEVELLPGTHWASSAHTVPSGKRLTGPRTAVLKATNASTQNDMLSLQPGQSEAIKTAVRGLTIDGNIPARESSGFASYTNGVRATNCKNFEIAGIRVVDAGETAAYGQDFACGIVADRNQSGAEVADGIIIRDNEVDDPSYKLPFGIRCRTDFNGVTERAASPLLVATVEGNIVIGTTKNACEYVGPDTLVTARRNLSRYASGQGGQEFDFGAQGEMEDCIVEYVGRNGVQDRTHDAFSVRCGEFTNSTPGLAPVGVKMRGNILRYSVQVGSFFLRLASDFGSTNTEWTDMRLEHVTKDVGASASRLIAFSLNAKLRAVAGAKITALSFDSVDEVVRITDGTQGYSELVFTLPQATIDRILSETPQLSGQTFIPIL